MSRSIEVEYILKDQDGKEVARFQNLDDAKHYDRMLGAADELYDLLANINDLADVQDNVKDDISFQLAKNAEQVIAILSAINGKKKAPKKETTKDVVSEEISPDTADVTELRKAS